MGQLAAQGVALILIDKIECILKGLMCFEAKSFENLNHCFTCKQLYIYL